MENQIQSVAADTLRPQNQAIDSTHTTQTEPYVLRETEGRSIYNLMGMDKFLKVSGKDTNGQFSLFFGYYVRNDSAPMHVHYEENEAFYVLDGDVLFQVGNERYSLKSGELVFLPKNIPHTYLVLSETAKMLFMTTPGGITEAFFEEMSSLKGPVAPEAYQAIFKAHAQGLVGPPLKA